MAVRPLDSAAFGFATNCFVCDPANQHGLRLSYLHHEEDEMVTTEFTLGAEYSGAPRYVHGGVILAAVDDAMAWAAIALAGRFAVVRETTTTFEHGVLLGRPHRVEARLERKTERMVHVVAVVVDEDGRRCARSRGRLVVLTTAGARSAIGDVTGEDTRYLRKERT
jgi:acyl-coenzyme A thioesterase PaaI-like protein